MKHYKTATMSGKKVACSCFIVPAYMLEKQILEGSREQKKAALYNLKLSEMIRGTRMANGRVRTLAAASHQTKRRVIYDMEHSGNELELPGKPVRYEGGKDTGDSSADEVYNNTGLTWDFYNTEFGRNSINDQGMTLVSSVNFGDKWDNAMWNGTQMVYGDGGGGFIKEETLTVIDVTAHELQHGVTQYSTPQGLEYQGQSGGLNESWSDCFGIMCKQWVNKQKVDESNWLIGEGLMLQGQALRSMKDPGTANPFDGQITKASDYQDNMDPHISSGPPNKAFYLACKKAGGFSWDKIGKVWYLTMPRLPQSATYQMAADNTFDIAGSLFGDGSAEQIAVSEAWHEVGVEAKKPDVTVLFAGMAKKISKSN